MGYLRCLPPITILTSLLVGPMARAEPPQLLPTRDVDIAYDVTLPSQPRVNFSGCRQTTRRRWHPKGAPSLDRRSANIPF